MRNSMLNRTCVPLRVSGDKTTTNALEHRKQNDDNEQTGSTSGATTAPPPVGDVHSFSGSAAKESSEVILTADFHCILMLTTEMFYKDPQRRG